MEWILGEQIELILKNLIFPRTNKNGLQNLRLEFVSSRRNRKANASRQTVYIKCLLSFFRAVEILNQSGEQGEFSSPGFLLVPSFCLGLSDRLNDTIHEVHRKFCLNQKRLENQKKKKSCTSTSENSWSHRAPKDGAPLRWECSQ